MNAPDPSAGIAASPAPAASPGAGAPFRRRAFAVLWAATVISNIGTWMSDVGTSWLMTQLSSSATMIAAVQAATMLPGLLLALPAGALADIYDRRRLLLWVNLGLCLAAIGLAATAALGLATPWLLLGFAFVFGAGAALIAPAWQAIVPGLVPRAELQAAVALNSLGINIARAVGPALGGALIVAFGLWSPFAANALSFVAVIGALIWWRPPPAPPSTLPPEHLAGALAAGLRHALNAPALLHTLARAAAFFLCVSAFWALLPLVASRVLTGGAELYGLLMGAAGAGAVAGALAMPRLKARFAPDRLAMLAGLAAAVALAALGLPALVMPALGLATPVAIAPVACALGGAAWIAALSTFNVSAQTALPDWVRGRGLSVFLMVFSGSMALGGLGWGRLAEATSVPVALVCAAALSVVLTPLARRFRLNLGAGMDLAPSGHWPDPAAPVRAPGAGPVMIRVTYRVPEALHPTFLAQARELRAARRRGGAWGWSLMRGHEDPESVVETWYEADWTQHLRHHARVTGADRDVQARFAALHRGEAPPVVEHFLSL